MNEQPKKTKLDELKDHTKKIGGKLREAWDENPVAVLLAAGAFFTGVGKVVDAAGSYRSKKAFAKEAEERAKIRRDLRRRGGL